MSPAEAHASAVTRVRAASRFFDNACARHPHWAAAEAFDGARVPGATAQRVRESCAAAADEAGLMRALRQLREFEMARIAFRDLAGLAPLDETLGDLSDLADACCTAALEFAEARLQERHGTPRSVAGAACLPVVLGMGKLGGRELNFSSDIDLIFCFTEAGETDGARALSTDEYFARLALDTGRLLSARTADGFVFRVDTMLRPFGSAGAPAIPFAAIEEYYQVHGREWERYALIKARPVAGAIEPGQRLLEALRPFVYRRYLDYNAIGSLRDLKRMIADEVSRKGMEDNVKLGAGGIRELEFIVQSFQLVRGGHEARLRDARLRPVLRFLGDSGQLDRAVAQRLDECYVFLRRLENAIQMYADEQTHALPAGAAARTALCAGLGFADWDALRQQLDAVRAFVQQEFGRIFGEPAGSQPHDGLHGVIVAIWNESLDAAATSAALREQGFGEPESLAQELFALRDARLARLMRDEGLRRLQQLLAHLLGEALQGAQPAAAAVRVLRIVHAVAGRANYLTLLRENQTARTQLLRLCAASPWLAEFIAQTPALLDTLLDPRTLYAPPDRQELFADLATRAAQLKAGDTEQAMDLLRRYQKEVTLRVAAADLMQALPLVKISDRLTWLAEALLDRTLALVHAEMAEQFGLPRRADGSIAEVGVVAYGKFGGIEMGYGSDLDIVFLHDCDALDADTAGGPRALASEVWLSRLVQRIVSWLSAQTPAGRAYEVDLELRPDGRRGLIIGSLSNFAQYQRDSAWTWEHQALTRARFVCGSAAIGAAFDEIRRETLTRPRDAGKLRNDLLDMRARMRQSLDKSGGGRWDVKQGRGGLTDCEFITQFLVLRDAPREPAIVQFSDNWRQLEALERAGAIGPAQLAALIECYRNFRAWTHARALQNQDALVDDGQFRAERETITTLWRELLEEPPAEPSKETAQ